MYAISLIFDGTEYKISHEHGFDITTINGLTGLDSTIDTVQNNVGMGEIYAGRGTVGGRTITVQGYILDHNLTAKQLLCNILTPLRQGTLKLYNIVRTGSGNTAYRQIDIVVKKTVEITQETHAKFSFTLYAPDPFWKDVTDHSFILQPNYLAVTETIDGNVDADFVMRIRGGLVEGEKLADFELYSDRHSVIEQYLHLDFTRLTGGSITLELDDMVEVGRKDGRFYIKSLIDNVVTDIISVLDTNSRMFRMPAGTHTFTYVFKNELGQRTTGYTAGIFYKPSYSGVVLSGI